jgi:Protein of unknown function (DUF2786)
MGRNNRQRRSEKQHKQAARRRAERGPTGAVVDAEVDVLGIVHNAARAAYGPQADDGLLDRVIDALVSAVSTGRLDIEPVLSNEFVRFLNGLYEGGWQPLDVVHVVRRQSSSRVTRLLCDVVGEEALRSGAAERAPQEWLEQLSAVEVGDSLPRGDALFSQWRSGCGLGLAEGLYEALHLVGMLLQLPRLSAIGPVPSQWSVAQRAPSATRRSAADPKLLARIRALLAKAEATTFEAEADAFTSKAQDLMTRHAIDAAVLLVTDHHDLHRDVVARRIHLDNPYAAEKVDLLATVCHSNGVRTVWNDGLGFATVVGLPVDLDLAELMFTSLLLQATRAVGDASGASARTRTRTFRRAFLVSYAQRIGERLDDAVQHANTDAVTQYGTSLVPILAARTEAVDDEFARMFPSTRAMRGGRFDPQGWAAGRAAADLAVLDAGRTRLTG